jgi:hypothetical protein
MIRFFARSRNRLLIMVLVFGVGPLVGYLVFIAPSILRISDYQKRVNLQAAGSPRIAARPAPATDRELEKLKEIRIKQLSRIKKIESRESLLHFSCTLADVLALKAQAHGLKVIHVDLQNSLIKGMYVPGSKHALEILTGLPSPQWDELANPLDLPKLNLPAIEISMTVASEYSQVFSYIESLPDFPVLVSLSSMSVIEDPSGKAFQLKVHGFYYRSDRSAQAVQLQNAALR